MRPISQPTPRLLAIDDSVLIHRLLKAHLQHEQVELHSATSGSEGVQMAKALCPDVILLDFDMEGMSGVDTLAALKSDPVTQHIPVLLLSGDCSTEDRVKGLDLGAVDFVLKPFEIAELKARVRSALRTTRLIKMLAHRAQIDAMTGLWNRAHFNERLVQELSEAKRYGSSVALILCDLDNFKVLNDTYGHPFGDFVLEKFAQLLNERRLSDITCRYGGEEFAIILPQNDAAGAAAAAERIRSLLEMMTWPRRQGLTVTASFGVSDTDLAGGFDPQLLIAAADRALYQAKSQGRNSVVVDETCVLERRLSA